jgi:biopolymer transport protein ExbB/TolQ
VVTIEEIDVIRKSSPRQDLELPEPELSWSRGDPEQWVGFRGGRFTRVNNWLSLLLAIMATISWYAILSMVPGSLVANSFTERGLTPYAIVMFAFWSLSILVLKSRKLAFQRRSLEIEIMPEAHDFFLSGTTVDQVIDRLHDVVDDPRQFVLFNRIGIALSSLRNLGRVSDVDEIFRSQETHDESSLETSYSLVKGFIWAIPVLGFIGTVLGLSEAVGGFADVLKSATEASEIVDALKIVTGGLATAFETTLQALVAALAIQIILVFLRKAEEEFLDDCSEYCLRRVVSRVRISG